MSERTLNRTDLQNLNNGAGFFASGGGGSVLLTREIIAAMDKVEGDIRVIDPEDVPDDDHTCMTIILGSPEKEAAANNRFRYSTTRTWDDLNKAAGVQMKTVMPGETGSINMITPMWVCKARGIPLVNCDSGGRSVPALSECAFAPHGSVRPMTFSSGQEKDEDATTVMAFPTNPESGDQMARSVVSSDTFDGYTGMSVYLMTGAQMKQWAVPNTLTMALTLGEKLAAHSGDPVPLVLDYLPEYNRKGWELIRGTITDMESSYAAGFDYATVTITADDGQVVTVMSQNENLLAWSNRSSHPIAMAPDLISYITPDGQPASNADKEWIDIGKPIILVGSTAPPQLRHEVVLNNFLTTIKKSFGYYGPYAPIESIHP